MLNPNRLGLEPRLPAAARPGALAPALTAALLAAYGLLVTLAAQAAPIANGSGAGTGRPSPAAAARLPGQIRPSDASTGFFLGAPVTASWGNSGIEMTAGSVSNQNASGTSGPLALALWATTTAPVFGDNISHNLLGPTYGLGTLMAGFEFTNVDSGLLTPYTPPPNGCYFVTVALDEVRHGPGGGESVYVDLATLSSGGVPDPGGSGFDLFGFGVPNSSCGHPTCPANTLCIDQKPGDGRFQIQITYSTVEGGGLSGSGNAIALSSLGVTQGGLFWFFGATNPEMLIKIIDACSLGGHFWVFYAATTNVGFTVTVTDTVTGHQAIYQNPDQTAALPVQDTSALSCP
jgi:hypothetical protein